MVIHMPPQNRSPASFPPLSGTNLPQSPPSTKKNAYPGKVQSSNHRHLVSETNATQLHASALRRAQLQAIGKFHSPCDCHSE